MALPFCFRRMRDAMMIILSLHKFHWQLLEKFFFSKFQHTFFSPNFFLCLCIFVFDFIIFFFCPRLFGIIREFSLFEFRKSNLLYFTIEFALQKQIFVSHRTSKRTNEIFARECGQTGTCTIRLESFL